MKPFVEKSHMFVIRTLLSVLLVLLLIAPLVSSCATSEPPPVVEETEDPHEALFNILASEKNHTSNLKLKPVQDFYINGIPVDILAKFGETPMTVELTLKASVDGEVFTEDAEYADFAAKFLKDSSLSINSKRDPPSKNSVTNFELSLSDQKLASAEILIEGGERFSLKSDELYPKYIALEYPELMKIAADTAHNPVLSSIPRENFFILQDKYIDLLSLADIDADRFKSATKPFVDKLRDVIADENISIEYDVAVDGLPGSGYKKVSAGFASEDLRQLLTALAQAAKENTALLALIKDKYAVFYECVVELAEFGIVDDAYFSGLPPVENIESLFQSSFAAFEVMLGSTAGLPIKALLFDFYLDGTTLKCVHIGAWTDLPETSPADGAGVGAVTAVTTATGANTTTFQNAGATGQNGEAPPEEETQPSSLSVIKSAGAPSISVDIKSFDDQDKWRNDSLTIIYDSTDGEDGEDDVNSENGKDGKDGDDGVKGKNGDDGVKNTISLYSKLSADKTGGENILTASFTGPALSHKIPNASVNFNWDSTSRSLLFITGFLDASGKEEPLIRFNGSMTDIDSGGFGLSAEFGFNDPDVDMPKKTAGGADQDPDSPYAVNVRCDGRITYGQVDIPSSQGEDVLLLVQDSFYDGTFETVFNEFYENLIRFASANVQLLSLYGFPGF